MANKYKYSFALHSAWNYQNEVEEWINILKMDGSW